MFTFGPVLEQIQKLFQSWIALIPNLIVAIIIFGIFLLIALIARRWAERIALRAGVESSGALVLGRMMRFLVLLGGALVSLAVLFPTFGAGQALELLGVSGVAIGFAFRDILQNFLAGIIILTTHPFRVGDQIIVNQFEGTVEEIQTRATYIKTYDGRRVVIPNADLLIQSVIVNTAFPIRRTEVEIVIHYQDDIDTVQRLMIEAMLTMPNVLPQPQPDAPVMSISASGVTLRARWWTQSVRREVVKMQDEVLTVIKKKLMDNGVQLPYEAREIIFHEQEHGNGANPLRRQSA
jgi:small conductance mechanosensitive channel